MVVDVSMIVEVMEWPKAMSTSSSWHHHAKGSRAQHVMLWMHQASMTGPLCLFEKDAASYQLCKAK